jgi:general secretion pathway protein J
MIARSQRGFTLLELIIALTLMVLVAGVLFGSLGLSARSWDAGEQRSSRSDQMRVAESFLRMQLSVAFPFRFKKMTGQPLAFSGVADSLRFAAPLISRVGQGGMFLWQLSLDETSGKHRLVLRRAIPDADTTTAPVFSDDDADKTILGDDIAELRISYFGPPTDQPEGGKLNDSAWADRWVDRTSVPQLVKLSITPRDGPAWPDLIVESRISTNAGCLWDGFHGRCVYL